ncbi:hypothetical protein Moror_12696 [Moniliophthora roreri MCA 2997]|uniref:Uncharacterized protein n=1 Tax=Moniliophthora roreri (strain MCA 2997) TaxID=1381753 RepID=V2XSH4_MONRO|nr:hypothetical protein Moror_12696 [Moniliophthora roreri MCA 2997]
MDELVQHCLREIAFDGDLGCSVSRLSIFVKEFYSNHATYSQNVDDSFCAFVWSLIVQQPTIHVGLVPEGVTSEVWIAPQVSAKRKANARGETHVETRPPRLELVPDAMARSMGDLQIEYGDKLRLACDPDATYAAITGSHLRFSKLSPMVYSALQVITRGRDKGVTVIHLGNVTGYDQKTCFYLVKQLVELNLVVKRRHGGVGTNFVVHKFIFDRSPSWKAVREEESKVEQRAQASAQATNEAEDEEQTSTVKLDFPPIDSRHLSSLPLVRARVIKLLKASKNNMHAAGNMIVTLGFTNPTKSDRRFFSSRIRELIEQGVIEKVIVPSKRKKSPKSSNVICLRLLDENATGGPSTSLSTLVPPEQEDEEEEELAQASGVKTNVTLHKQMFDLLEESGTRGMTLNELSAALDNFDKRTVELLLTRAEKLPPPAHLSDLSVASLMETVGRERRHRYFIVSEYRRLVEKENLDQSTAGYADIDMSDSGNFLNVDATAFYEDEDYLRQYQDCFRDGGTSAKVRKKPPVNPILPDGSVKQGRPRKKVVDDDGNVVEGSIKKRKRADNGDEDAPPKKRGRPPKVGTQESASAPVPKKRGRPPKSAKTTEVAGKSTSAPVPKEGEGPSKDTVTEEAMSGTAGATEEALTVEPISASFSRSITQPLSLERSTLEPMVQVEPQVSEPGPAVEIDAPAMATSAGDEPIILPDDVVMDTDSRAAEPQLQDKGTQDTADSGTQDAAQVDSGNVPQYTIIPKKLDEDSMVLDPDAVPVAGTKTSETSTRQRNSKPKAQSRSRINVSGLRRENEFLRVLERMGGIANIHTKEFYDEHTALVEQLVKAGEPTSGPVGIRTDKRTVSAAFNSLENRGKVKQITAAVSVGVGTSRAMVIVYLPDISEDKLNEFLATQGQPPPPPAQPAPVRRLDEPMEFGSGSRRDNAIAPVELLHADDSAKREKGRHRWHRNMEYSEKLLDRSDEEIRNVLLAERSTLGYAYGSIMGKCLRARELHLIVLSALEVQNSSAQIVSYEKKIIHLAFLAHDLPLSVYMKIVTPVEHSEEVHDFIRTQSGRNTLVRDLPSNISTKLGIGKSRARSKLQDSLTILRHLGIATPIQESTSSTACLTCAARGEHPTSFEKAPLEWSNSTGPVTSPVYWVFNDVATIYHWGQPESAPPFLGDFSVATSPAATEYWGLLREACVGNTPLPPTTSQSVTGPLVVNASIARTLRRRQAWDPDYILTWHQTQYLKRYIDISSQTTPLDEPDGCETRLAQIAWVISAPPEIVRQYYESIRGDLTKEIEKTRKRLKKEAAEKREQEALEAKAALAKKAEEAKRQRENDWDALLQRVHSEPLKDGAAARIKRIRTRFLQSTASSKDTEKWEKDVSAAIQEADVMAKKVLKKTSVKKPPITSIAPPVATNPPEKSVRDLIAEQGPPVNRPPPPKKRRKTETVEEDTLSRGNIPQKRYRFQWNREYEELARDASAIIKARCRDAPRLDWGAYEQVFPAVPRNTVRQRIVHMRENPAHSTYLQRLEDKWYEVWVQHRGSAHLPDDDPTSATNFNLVEHIEFLRKHIDKNALRVGYSQVQQNTQFGLPADVEILLAKYHIVESSANGPTYDFFWNGTVEEGREKAMLNHSFTMKPDSLAFGEEALTEVVFVAESALKVVLGTPNEAYDPERASSLLHSVGEDAVSAAMTNLLGQGVLSKLVRDPKKQRPGRLLKISDFNQNALHGNISQDLFQDASALRELSIQQEGVWREWPLLATDGDLAAMVQLVSDDKVDFRVDTSQPQRHRPTLDWNSKKADDDHMEPVIFVRFREMENTEPQSDMDIDSSPILGHEDPVMLHGKAADGNPGCCRRSATLGIIDCASCLEEAWSAKSKTFSGPEMLVAQLVMWLVSQAGKRGITKEELAMNTKTPLQDLLPSIGKLVQGSHPLLYWVGYTTPLLIGAAHMQQWTVVISLEPMMRILPRRWMNINGYKMMNIWQAASRAVIGTIIFHPGISQYELRWRLRLTYDRREVIDILTALQADSRVRNRCELQDISTTTLDSHMIAALDEKEEKRVFWFLDESKHWYDQV